MATCSGELTPEENAKQIASWVKKLAFENLKEDKFPSPPKFIYNPSRDGKDVHPDLFNSGWFRRYALFLFSMFMDVLFRARKR